VSLVPGLRSRCAVGRAILRPTTWSSTVGGPTESDLPAALPNLDFSELGRRQLRDECREELVDEAIDRSVILETGLRGPSLVGSVGGRIGWHRVPPSSIGSALVGHALDLLAGRWLLATASLWERHADRPSPRVEQIPEAIGDTGSLGLGDWGR
jgi:hypothetical protein